MSNPRYSQILAEAIKSSGLKAPEFAAKIGMSSKVVLAALNDEGPLPHEAHESVGNVAGQAVRGRLLNAIHLERLAIEKLAGVQGPARALLLELSEGPAPANSAVLAAVEALKHGRAAAAKAAKAKKPAEEKLPEPGSAPAAPGEPS